ncbi:hypothetical protein [Elstera cyanobacteriorum]|uniref:hypothetical protein n=1 Tax=Elstera cyanobacteriorum TaxID=2022747 RepID=UPI0023564556|nr:hypothetical protein [Elstera cyanobacteriorum]MCK6442316.1 hypothetical protein [Elstera cyanobacteriorum]
MSQEMTLAQVRQKTDVEVGFFSSASFELMQRVAKVFASSNIVPTQYRSEYTKGTGRSAQIIQNPNALANCIIAIGIAQRMRADILMVMQNLYIVEGRPSWSSVWIISAINLCGRFSPLKFEMRHLGEKEISYEETYWEDDKKQRRVKKTIIDDYECVAWATEKQTGDRLESIKVSVGMAVKEGWYQKTGSKWQTMPELMLRYRCASFFGKVYAPELLMGLSSAEEVADTIEITPDGEILGVTTEALRRQPIDVTPATTETEPQQITQSADVEITPTATGEGEDDTPAPVEAAPPGQQAAPDGTPAKGPPTTDEESLFGE